MVSKFRTWLRSDMRVMRWVFLALYVALLAGLVGRAARADDAEGSHLLGLLAVIVASQALFVLGTGTVNLCRPIRRRRLWVPVAMAAVLLSTLTFCAMWTLSELISWEPIVNLMVKDIAAMLLLVATPLIWGAVSWAFARDIPRMRALGKLTGALFCGGLAVLLASMPAYVIVNRRNDLNWFGPLVPLGGITAGICVVLFSFGPAIVLLFLRPRYRREKMEAGENGREAATQAALSPGSG